MPSSRANPVTPEQFTTFGELLKFLRRRAGLTQLELSIATGYSESQISRLELNRRTPDLAAVAARFVSALHLESEKDWGTRLLELATPSPTPTPALPRTTGEGEREGTPHNLPIQLTSFVGREKQLTEIRQWLTPLLPRVQAKGRDAGYGVMTRLITLTGPGGTGKTRLALQAASELLKFFPDGVWLIELAPLADPALLPQAVAAVLGSKLSGQATLSALLDVLRDRQALLILDNCEHLIQATAQFVDALLHACPKVRILATSRELLGTAGERSFYVPSLSTPEPNTEMLAGGELRVESLMGYEAVRLFVERAATVSLHFTLTDDNAPAVAQICQRLDGIPLAIELAAARLRMLSVEQIAARLDNAFRLLTGGSRTALPRHQTLQALIDWSYDLLTRAERTLFRRLAVFSGGWTLDAAESICAGDGVEAGEVFELLAHLIDKSLVRVVQPHSGFKGQEARGTRYKLLETIRQYALDKLLLNGEADVVRRHHAEYYLRLAEAGAPGAPDQPTDFEWLLRLETEQANLRTALAWSLSTMDSDAKLQLTGSGDVRVSAWALNRLGWLARESGDLVTARSRLEQSLAVYRELDDKVGIAWTAVTLGEVLVMQGEATLATTILEEGLALAREQRETRAIGWALNHLGHVAQIEGEYEKATRLHKESLAVFCSHRPYRQGIAWAHQSLGETALAQGNETLAQTHLSESLRLFYDMEDGEGVAWCLAGLAGVAVLETEPEQAAGLWGAAEALRVATRSREAPASHATRERLMRQARAQLQEERFAAAWARGETAARELLLQGDSAVFDIVAWAREG